MTPNEPHTFERRVLLAVSGLTPQVVTETLYALIHQPAPFVPTEVRLITTAEGAARARLALLSEDPGWFRRLCLDYALPPIAFGEAHIHTIEDASGVALADIRTPADNQHAADRITDIVRTLTADPGTALHVSIAGGRKTMGYYLGYALSLFGRPQDRLSHVLVSEPFESSWEFFYPTRHERIIQTRDGKLADCREARVTLAEIPFVRLREGLPPGLLTGHASLSEVVAAANRALMEPHLFIDINAKSVTADGVALDLSPTELAVLLWLAERAGSGEPNVCWQDADEAEGFLAVAARLMNSMTGEYERCEKAIRERSSDPKMLGEYFEPHKSRIKTAFETALGRQAAARYLIQRDGPRGHSYYYLPLEPGQIEICDQPGTGKKRETL
ncbi:CRISPR-associated ring nuclease Csm6 [Thiobacter aerophilum]|uniref:CRISPR-associated ring nuclease Csm6 n=1 Tax=Thiobacter aerophilum TaxID=3121275 RepID=A0ABV0EE22_9BURK